MDICEKCKHWTPPKGDPDEMIVRIGVCDEPIRAKAEPDPDMRRVKEYDSCARFEPKEAQL